MSISTISRYATAVVLLHTVITIIHGAAHLGEMVMGSVLDNIFIVSVIWLAPLVAIYLLWRRRWQAGSTLLLLAMLGALIYGVYNHFIAPGLDNVVSFPAGPWQIYFQVTAVVLALLEAVGVVLGAMLVWLSIAPHPLPPSPNSERGNR